MTRPASPAARELARRLVARHAADGDDPEAIGAALQRACTRMSENLRDVVGDDGYSALLARVLAATVPDHPPLREMCRPGDSTIHLNGMIARVDSYGAPATGAAIEAMFATLVDALSTLIGPDMVLNLLDSDDRPNHTSEARPAP